MKNIDSDLIRGNIDTIILTTMLDGDKYGLDIIKDVETKSNGTYELKQPTLYSCLKRLENQELISSYWLDSDIGGRRHYYKLTEKGRNSLLQKQEEWAKSKFIIDNLLSNHDYDEYRLVKKEDYDKIIEGKQFEYSQPPIQDSEIISNKTNSEISESETFNSNAEDVNDEFENINANNYEVDDDSENAILDEIKDEVDNEIDDILEYESLIEDDETSNDESSTNDDTLNEKYFSSKQINYSDESDDIENDYPNQKRFKIPSIYDTIDISDDELSDSKTTLDNYEDVDSIETDAPIFDSLDDVSNADSNDEDDEQDNISNFDESDDEFIFNDLDLESDFESNFDDDRVYVSDYDDKLEDDDLNISVEPIADQSANELNILSKLRMQDDDEINEYVGDKNSYVNHLNKNEDIEILKSENLNVIQEDLLSNDNYLSQSSIDNQINEFSTAIDKLNHFGLDSKDEQDSLSDDENYDEPLTDSTYNEHSELPIEIEDELIQNNNMQQESEDIIEFKKSPNFDDDYLSELEELKSLNNQGFFNSNDSADYEIDNLKSDNYQNIKHFDNLDDFLQSEETDAQFEKQLKEYNSQFGYDSDTINQNKPEYDYQQNDYPANTDSSSDFETFDEIISKNVDSYTSDLSKITNNDEYHSFTPSFTANNYKQKLNNLSTYSKVNQDDLNETTAKNNDEIMDKVKDIQSLKAEFEDEGICIKEYKRTNGHSDVDRTYLLINKMNLIKSLILLFGYVFLLSAVYIIMNNTGAKSIYNFSFKYFLYGFIPFGIYTIYYAVLFIINPYKKIPAKFAPRIMIFIAIIITIQLLLITYCVNLQLGFYSFSQNLYNHLFWVIPTIISFAPIITTLIHIALYYSKNFNV